MIRYTLFYWTLMIVGLLTIPSAYGQKLHFKDTILQIGTLSEDDEPIRYDFFYKNESSNPITIKKIVTTCGCTQVKFKKTAIAPEEEGIISVTFYPLGRVGKVNKSIAIYTDEEGNTPNYTLLIEGEVTPSSDPYINYPYAIGPLRLMQTTVDFRNIIDDKKRMLCIEVVNTGNHPLSLNVLHLPIYLCFGTQPSIIAPHEKGDLRFVLDPKKLNGTGEFNNEVQLNGVGNIPELQRIINIRGKKLK